MLPWGVHRATADSELLRCVLRQDTIVDDRKHVHLTADRHFFLSEILGPILILDLFPAGFKYHGNSLGFFVLEPAAMATLPARTV